MEQPERRLRRIGWARRLPSEGVSPNLSTVIRPLAIVFYEKLLPGTQVVNRLTDLGYRVTATQTAVDVPRLVREHRPMVVIADLALRHGDFCGIISQLRASPELAHVPVLGYCDSKNRKLVEAALEAGAKLVAAEQGIPDQLAQLLDHVLAVE